MSVFSLSSNFQREQIIDASINLDNVLLTYSIGEGLFARKIIKKFGVINGQLELLGVDEGDKEKN